MNLNDKFLLERIPKIAENNLSSPVSELKFIGGGSFGRVYKGTKADGETIILKAYYVKEMEKTEASQLKILGENTSVTMPKVYFTHDDEIALLCMSFIDGKNTLDPSFLLKNKEQKQAFANEVVDGMLQWHSVKGEKYGYLENAVYDSWKEFYIENKVSRDLAGLKKLMDEGKYSKKNYDLLCRGLDIFKEVVNEPETPVLIHGDLNIMNIMADPKDMKLTGFIDPCGSMWADREYDLFQFLNMWGNAYNLYNTYKSKCKMSEHCDFKVAFYGALHENSMRLKGGLIVPVWEIQNNNRLQKAMKKY
ncbi:MAG: aminoglycoside phosphotransferase family protein [Clostridia bacterium]|nr:aminoglycoside phosphotransferase family protein [Clostridia bacterium]